MFCLLTSLFIIDTWSTIWLNTNAPVGFEVNPVMAVFLHFTSLFIIAKILISIVILVALWKLKTLSSRAFAGGLCFTFVIYGAVCINNLVGVYYLW